MSTEKLKIYGQLESGLVGGYVTDKTQVSGLSDALDVLDGAITTLDNKTLHSTAFDSDTFILTFKDKEGNPLATANLESISQALSRDGMLDDVDIVTIEDEKYLEFTWKNVVDEEGNPKKDRIKTSEIGKVYKGSDSISIDESTNEISVNEVSASVAKIDNPIIIAGGPLADDTNDNWPNDWKDPDDSTIRVIPAGTSIESIISKLLAKVIDGTVSWSGVTWNPTMKQPSISLDKSGTVEVGTEATITASPTAGIDNNTRIATLSWSPSANGYFIGDTWSNAAKTVSVNGNTPTGALSVSTSLKIGNNAGTITNSKFTVGEGTNTVTATQTGYTVTSGTLPSTTAYASTNTKVKLANVSVTLTDNVVPTTKTPTATTKTASVTGARYMFWGADNVTTTLDSAYIRANKKGTAASAASTKTMDVSGVTRLWVAVPSGRTVTNIYGANGEQMGSYMGSTTLTTVNVEGLNGFTSASYKLYTFISGAPLTETITIKIS